MAVEERLSRRVCLLPLPRLPSVCALCETPPSPSRRGFGPNMDKYGWDQCSSSANDLTAASGSLSRNCALLWVPHIPFGVSYSPPRPTPKAHPLFPSPRSAGRLVQLILTEAEELLFWSPGRTSMCRSTPRPLAKPHHGPQRTRQEL